MKRQTGRIFPIDETGAVLLMHGFDPARRESPFWFSIGGGLDGGETTAEAAAREAFEEVGLRIEQDTVDDCRWCALPALVACGETFYPEDLWERVVL